LAVQHQLVDVRRAGLLEWRHFVVLCIYDLVEVLVSCLTCCTLLLQPLD
jgi:hypothetical protein